MDLFRCGLIKPVILIAFLTNIQSYAEFQPERICKVRKKISLNKGWKFINEVTNAAPKEPGYNDASWPTVNLPHSARYAAPTNAAERATMPTVGGWSGISWYRRSLTLPSAGYTQKVFLEFEGAMSSADVYLNGTLVGSHMAGGFTGFWYDVSSVVNRTGSNILAVRLDCNYRSDVPPGKLDTAGNEYPDFLLFSGLHRDVWLICAGDVSIPPYGQKITTPIVTPSRSSARIRTTVNNHSAAAVNATVHCVIVDKNDHIIAEKSASAPLGAGASSEFDMTVDSMSGIAPWSPETPALYRVFTKVFVNGIAVDDYVERFGFRTLSWTAAEGFFLNGKRCELRGVNMHSEFAWVGHALPASRYFEEVRLAKAMGANAIRCAHYPRDRAFYDACDEIGMLCEPEVPTWGGQTTAYPAVFWERLTQSAREMVEVGYNHPSIILWGIFNEAPLNSTFVNRFRAMHQAIKAIDSTRFTSNINNKWYPPGSDAQNGATDVHGLNYALPSGPTSIRVYNAEYAQGWVRWCRRGDTVTDTLNNRHYYSENDYSDLRWSGSSVTGDIGWTQIAQNAFVAGGHMWVFVDYWSANEWLSNPMGALDHYRIPKKVYYTFQTKWTGATDDYPVVGLTPSRLRLEADVTALVADSTDLSRIIASVRDNSGRCVWTARDITFRVSGPCTVFEDISKPITTIAGKIGIILKSTNTPGIITVSASAQNLAPDTVRLTSAPRDESALPFIWPGTGTARPCGASSARRVFIRQNGAAIVISALPDNTDVSLLTLQGRKVECSHERNGAVAIIRTAAEVNGICFVKVTAEGGETIKKIVWVR